MYVTNEIDYWDAQLLASALALAINMLFWREGSLAKIFSRPQKMAMRFIDLLDRRYNKANLPTKTLRMEGTSILILVTLTAVLAGVILSILCSSIPYGWVLQSLIMSTMLNVGALIGELKTLKTAIDRSHEEGRATLTYLSGTNASDLEDPFVVTSAIQYFALEYRRSVIAPVIYFLLFGLSGLFLIKAIAIANQLVGHHTRHRRRFGWAFAKARTILVWPVAPVSAAFIALTSIFFGWQSFINSACWAYRGAKLHPYTAEGWTEGAIAGALNVQLSPERHYDTAKLTLPPIGPKGNFPETADIIRTRLLFGITIIVIVSLFFLLAVVRG